MSAIHGAITSVAIGLSDHINRGVVERTPIRGVLTLVFGGGLLAALAAGFAAGGEPSPLDLGLGALSGLVAAAALVALYGGYRVASAGVVGPPAATLSVVVPVAYDLVGGRLPSALTSAGIIIGAMSVILLSFNPRFEGRRALGLAMAAVSGLLYGTMFIVIDMFDPLAGYWTVVVQRMVAMCCFVVPAMVAGRPAMPPRGLRWQAMLGGLIGGVGLLSFAYGVREGDLAPVAVAATQYAAVTVFLAFCFRGERLRWWQTIGLCGSSIAVALVIAG